MFSVDRRQLIEGLAAVKPVLAGAAKDRPGADYVWLRLDQAVTIEAECAFPYYRHNHRLTPEGDGPARTIGVDLPQLTKIAKAGRAWEIQLEVEDETAGPVLVATSGRTNYRLAGQQPSEPMVDARSAPKGLAIDAPCGEFIGIMGRLLACTHTESPPRESLKAIAVCAETEGIVIAATDTYQVGWWPTGRPAWAELDEGRTWKALALWPQAHVGRALSALKKVGGDNVLFNIDQEGWRIVSGPLSLSGDCLPDHNVSAFPDIGRTLSHFELSEDTIVLSAKELEQALEDVLIVTAPARYMGGERIRNRVEIFGLGDGKDVRLTATSDEGAKAESKVTVVEGRWSEDIFLLPINGRMLLGRITALRKTGDTCEIRLGKDALSLFEVNGDVPDRFAMMPLAQ